jgi:Domain of unknown function (DUF4124)
MMSQFTAHRVSQRTESGGPGRHDENLAQEIIMKRPVKLLSMIAAAALSASMAAPAALAGNEIVKCIDASGHVTLTDQPCAAGSATVKLSSEAPLPQRHVLPATELRQDRWKRPQEAKAAPLSRDVATLKAARRMLMLQEARPRLAGLD